MNSLGNKLKITVFGQSHAPAIGVTMDGLPPGMRLDIADTQTFLERRAPGRDETATARKETDAPHILCGLNEKGVTCGAPLTAVFDNQDTKSADYKTLQRVPRPGHGDYAAWLQAGENHDIRGGGQFSGRLTAPLCFAGAVCLQYLKEKGVKIQAHISRLAGIDDAYLDWARPALPLYAPGLFPTIDQQAGGRMRQAILAAKAAGDSVGGVIECCAVGVPGGLGGPMFEGVENRLAAALFGIPAVKGVEFGAGFGAADMRGSEHNDPFMLENEKIRTATNNHGGALGGITTGMPLILRAAVKPTPSIALAQQSVDLVANQAVSLTVPGRHDPSIVPRAVPVVEAVTAIVLMDMLLEGV